MPRATGALAGYRLVITGSHPEYVSLAIIDALEAHVHRGGRLMYLGGNGHYWVTAGSTPIPHLIEIRRGNFGGRTWESAPGEAYLSQHRGAGRFVAPPGPAAEPASRGGF